MMTCTEKFGFFVDGTELTGTESLVLHAYTMR